VPLINLQIAMDKFLQTEFLNNTIRDYLYVIGIILLAVIIKRLISKYLAKLLYKLVAKAAKNIERQSFLDLVVEPLDLFLVLIVSIIALDKLHFPSDLDFNIYHITLKQLIDSIAAATVIIVFIWLCLRVIDFVAMILEEKANLTLTKPITSWLFSSKIFLK
jgi:MscS family membrane protein